MELVVLAGVAFAVALAGLVVGAMGERR